MVSPVPRQETLAVVPALIAAAASIFLIRSGFFLLFFLMPFGFIGFRYNGRSMWACFGAAAFANGLLVAGTMLIQKIPAGEMLWDIVFFTSMGAVFTWITAPIQGKANGAFSKIPGVYRFIIGSVLCAVVFMGLFFRALGDQLFYNVLRQQVESITALYKSGSSDVVQNALLESLTPELVLDAAKSLVLRGGALVSLVLIFAINRQGSIVLARLFKSPYQGGNLRTFHVHSRFISVLSVTLALLVVTRMLKWAWPEIVLWNILVLCVILYLAQGLGILQHFLARPVTPPFARLLLPLLFIIMIFSPGINAVLLGIIVILGIAENWAPFRAPKKDGPPSTPEA